MLVQSNEEGLVFRLSEHTPDVVRQILLERGWLEYDENDEENEGEWNLWWRTQRFRRSEHAEIAHWQRLNHFPKTDAITRKDCLVRNLRRMRCVHGISVYDFHPLSYILPNEYTKFVSDYAKESQKKGGKNSYWICKPTDLSRGRGIFVFKDLKDLNYDCPVIVQRYISSPLLISGYKFDLRIYVCVPSFQPLTIYIYQEGIVRFGTDKFDLAQLGNVFSHLTNTSINKYGPSYSTDKERVGPGCKWTLSQLRSFLRQMDNIDETLLWQRISNIVTLTIATQAPTVPKSQSCFELFGFDILIDENMKPWLLEVNFSPALGMDCQADFIAKHSMLNDLIDLLNFKASDSERGGKSYRECRSPSPGFSPRRSPRYRKTQATKDERTLPSTTILKAQNYTYSKPMVSKYSPLLLGRFKHNRANAGLNKSEKKSTTPRVASRLVTQSMPDMNQSVTKNERKSSRKLPSIIRNDEESDKDESKSSDSGISSGSPIPRNLSSSSMASSQSSVDNCSKYGVDDELYPDLGTEVDEPLNAPKTDLSTTKKNWILGPDGRNKNQRSTVCTKEMRNVRSRLTQIARQSNPNFAKEKLKGNARTQSGQQYSSKSLPRIQPRQMTPRPAYGLNRPSRTAPSGEDLQVGAGNGISGKCLYPIVETSQKPSIRQTSLDSITETEKDSKSSTPVRTGTPKINPKALRKKKNATSAPNARTPVEWTPEDRFRIMEEPFPNKSITTHSNSTKSTKKKSTSTYKSPYSIESTRTVKTSASNPWPRTRVGDFVLTFPWNETLRKASGSNFDMKTIIKEQQKIMKKLLATSKENVSNNGTQRRRSSAAISSSEAIELSFMLKFEDKDSNPLYFWGPQNPPLLSNVLS